MMSFTVLSSLVSVLTIYLALPANATPCYQSNGNAMDLAYQPCNQIQGQTSVCCALNRTSGADLCLPNGLCQWNTVDDNGVDVTHFWREGCSVEDWGKGACLNECLVNIEGFDDYSLSRSIY